jgi:hypothetical protein
MGLRRSLLPGFHEHGAGSYDMPSESIPEHEGVVELTAVVRSRAGMIAAAGMLVAYMPEACGAMVEFLALHTRR